MTTWRQIIIQTDFFLTSFLSQPTCQGYSYGTSALAGSINYGEGLPSRALVGGYNLFLPEDSVSALLASVPAIVKIVKF